MKSIKDGFAQVAILGAAILIIIIFGYVDSRKHQRPVIKHKQFIVGDRQPGQIPDSTAVDSNDNTTYFFNPVK